jgi:hypothetical protein
MENGVHLQTDLASFLPKKTNKQYITRRIKKKDVFAVLVRVQQNKTPIA